MKQPVQYTAQIGNVAEVSLRATASLAFWKERLLGEGLTPIPDGELAQILVVGAKLKYLGVAFQEMSFSVLVSGALNGRQAEGWFLFQAFNSNRLLAFCERILFSTPYTHASVRVTAARPASLRLRQHDELLFETEMNAGSAGSPRRPSTGGDGGWEGPVFLPSTPGSRESGRKLFFACLKGRTFTYGFSRDRDAFMINSSSQNSLAKNLVESEFTPQEWIVRENAFHAKSKTYLRTKAPQP